MFFDPFWACVHTKTQCISSSRLINCGWCNLALLIIVNVPLPYMQAVPSLGWWNFWLIYFWIPSRARFFLPLLPVFPFSLTGISEMDGYEKGHAQRCIVALDILLIVAVWMLCNTRLFSPLCMVVYLLFNDGMRNPRPIRRYFVAQQNGFFSTDEIIERPWQESLPSEVGAADFCFFFILAASCVTSRGDIFMDEWMW